MPPGTMNIAYILVTVMASNLCARCRLDGETAVLRRCARCGGHVHHMCALELAAEQNWDEVPEGSEVCSVDCYSASRGGAALLPTGLSCAPNLKSITSFGHSNICVLCGEDTAIQGKSIKPCSAREKVVHTIYILPAQYTNLVSRLSRIHLSTYLI
ncbi:hypothetical protein AC1031_017319 [Aphanomyces cochlioides]|nr:hypothetical protein AC1031_017319 [Aphanomyces cochlioides]